ncbi:MAG: thymidine phosphorylase family protein [Gammaproteobacteria bacterium]|nr:thymidine phosphorylase family protein [Gammaproteobacteria bacterium]
MATNDRPKHALKVRRLGIDTFLEPVVFIRRDSPITRSEGFGSRSRVEVRVGDRAVIATLNVVQGDLVASDEAGLSEAAWKALAPATGSRAQFTHPPSLESLGSVRAKIYGHRLGAAEMKNLINDIAAGRYSDAHLAAFIAACGGDRLSVDEIVVLTRAMVEAGDQLSWGRDIVVDKHSIGGIPGNRTTLIVVPIVAALGLMMPKTSSRAITSPAGTADTMEVLAPVELAPAQMRKVVEREGACIVWGGAVRLSPADDILIQVERQLDVDSEGQMVASVLSKKAAAGSTHVIVDLPVGPTAKVRSATAAHYLVNTFRDVGKAIGLKVDTIVTDGSQPIGRGIGPALEARDVLAVLQCQADAPKDLRERSIMLAGAILEQSGRAPAGSGAGQAASILDCGEAWKKFQSICEAQGGMRDLPPLKNRFEVCATHGGTVSAIDNRRIALTAKLAGAPYDPNAGLDLHVRIGSAVEVGQPLFTVHADSAGELEYALDYYNRQPGIIEIDGQD